MNTLSVVHDEARLVTRTSLLQRLNQFVCPHRSSLVQREGTRMYVHCFDCDWDSPGVSSGHQNGTRA